MALTGNLYCAGRPGDGKDWEERWEATFRKKPKKQLTEAAHERERVRTEHFNNLIESLANSEPTFEEMLKEELLKDVFGSDSRDQPDSPNSCCTFPIGEDVG